MPLRLVLLAGIAGLLAAGPFPRGAQAQSDLAESESQLAEQGQAIQALNLLYELQQEFSARDYEACEKTIAALEAAMATISPTHIAVSLFFLQRHTCATIPPAPYPGAGA